MQHHHYQQQSENNSSSKIAKKCILSIHLDKNTYYAGETMTGKVVIKCPFKEIPSSPLINENSLDNILHIQDVLVEVEGRAKTQVGGLYPYFTKVDFEEHSTNIDGDNDNDDPFQDSERTTCSSKAQGGSSWEVDNDSSESTTSSCLAYQDPALKLKYPSERESLGRSDNYRILHTQKVLFDVNEVENKECGDIRPGHQIIFPFSYRLSQSLQPTLKDGQGVLSGKDRRIKVGVKRHSGGPRKDDPFYYAYKVIGSASICYKIHVTIKKQGLFPQSIEHSLDFSLRKKRKSLGGNDPSGSSGSKLISAGERELFQCCGGRITRRADPFVHRVMKTSRDKSILDCLMCFCVGGSGGGSGVIENDDGIDNNAIIQTTPSIVPLQPCQAPSALQDNDDDNDNDDGDAESGTTNIHAPSRLAASPAPAPASTTPPKSASVSVRTEVERGSYFPGEVINFTCFINNENTTIGFEGLRISFTQHLLVNIDGEPTSSFTKLLDHVILPKKILPSSKHELCSKLKIPEFNGIQHRKAGNEFPLPPYVQCRHFSNSYSLNVELILESFGGVGADPVNSIFIDICQKPLSAPVAPMATATTTTPPPTPISNTDEKIFPLTVIRK